MIDYETIEFKKDYPTEDLVRLWKEGLPELDEKRVKWAYENNPYGKATVYLLWSRREKQAVGCCAVLPRVFYFMGEKALAGIPVDFVITKEHRSLGPALKLQREVINKYRSNGYDFLIAFPNKKAEPVQKRLGYKYLGFFKEIYFIKSFSFIFAQFPFLIKKGELKKLKDIFIQHLFSKKDYRQIKTRSVENMTFNLIGDRSENYVKWRFFNNPYKKYHYFDNNKQYIIYSKENRILHILDIEPINKEVGSLDLNSINKFINEVKSSLFHISMIDAIPFSVNKKYRFFSKDSRDAVLIYFKDEKLKEKIKPFIFKGDIDF